MNARIAAGATERDRRAEAAGLQGELGNELDALEDIAWTASLLGDHAADDSQEPSLWAHAFRMLGRAVEDRKRAIHQIEERRRELIGGG